MWRFISIRPKGKTQLKVKMNANIGAELNQGKLSKHKWPNWIQGAKTRIRHILEWKWNEKKKVSERKLRRWNWEGETCHLDWWFAPR